MLVAIAVAASVTEAGGYKWFPLAILITVGVPDQLSKS
jgi:hypothetical protein